MFKIYNFEGKSNEEVEKKIAAEIGLDEVIIKEKNDKSSLISKKVNYQVLKKSEVCETIKTMINEMGELMASPLSADVVFEDKIIKINIEAEDKGIIIGKNGRTLQAIQYLLGQIIRKAIDREYRIILDVGNYKKDKQKSLERDIRFIADDVVATKVGVKLDYMNSYERRIVHNVINEYDKLKTESKGEEPERYINIIYIENEE